MVGVLVVLHHAHVGDQAAGKHLDTTVVSNYSLWKCTQPLEKKLLNSRNTTTFIHTHTVHLEISQHLKFCYSLIIRTTHHGIHTLSHYAIQV